MTHMYYADLEVTYADGSIGAKRFEGLSLTAVQDKASAKLKEVIETSKLVKKQHGDKTFQVVKHKITAAQLKTDKKFNA